MPNRYGPDINKCRSIRLKGYDYSQPGYYFVTICTHNRECLFGRIEGDVMVMRDTGRMLEKWWLKLPDKFPTIQIASFIVMPNHFHGIIQYRRARPM